MAVQTRSARGRELSKKKSTGNKKKSTVKKGQNSGSKGGDASRQKNEATPSKVRVGTTKRKLSQAPSKQQSSSCGNKKVKTRKSSSARSPLNRADSRLWVILPHSDRKIEDEYKIGKHLGQPGMFGYARLVTHKKTGEERAAKIIKKGKFAHGANKATIFAQMASELEIMKDMDHPTVIKFYEAFECPDKLYLVMEMCSGGELYDRIAAKGGGYSEKHAARMLSDMCESIQYLHSKNIAHLDIKPENFLFSNESKRSPLKLIDFGMSRVVTPRVYFNKFCGTCYYIAPEVLKGKFNQHSDMWSIGVVMFILLFGYAPFDVPRAPDSDDEDEGDEGDWSENEQAESNNDADMDDEMQIMKAVEKGFNPVTKRGRGAWFPSNIPCSEQAKDLLKKLLTLDISKRLTAEETLHHPWMSGKQASKVPMVRSVVRHLGQFTHQCRLKQAVLNVMTHVLSEEELSHLKDSFEHFDKDGDGRITLEEFKEACAQAGKEYQGHERKRKKKARGLQRKKTRVEEISEEEQRANAAELEARMENLLKSADIDGDGTLSYEELLMMTVQRKITSKEERLYDAFCKLDLDGDGMITAEELATALKGTGIEEAQGLIAEVDTDKNGMVDYDEFVAMWGGKADQKAPVTLSRQNSLLGKF